MKQRPIMYALAAIAAVIAVVFLVPRLRGANAAEKTQYKIAKVERATVKKTVSATGTLQPWTVVDIKSKAGGRVDKLLVDEGSEVKKGQVLARIDPTDTQLAYSQAKADIESADARIEQNGASFQLQVRQSQIAIQNARAQLASAKASYAAAAARVRTAQDNANAQPRLTSTSVQQAQANYQSAREQREQLNSSQLQETAAAQAAVDQAEANFENANANLTRQQSLLGKGFVSQSVVDQASASAKVAQAQLNSARERLRTLAAEQRSTRNGADARVAQARAQVDNARSQIDVRSRQNAVLEAKAALQQAKAQVATVSSTLDQAIANQRNNEIRRLDITSAQATRARAAASLTNAKTTLDQTTVRAPSDGVVLKKYVEEGTIITSGLSLSSTGTSILQMGDTSKMYVNVAVDETDIANVDEGQKVDVTIEAYPGIPFEGKVTRVNPQAQVEQNVTTVTVRVEIDNSSPTFRLLKPAMNATCEFIISQKDDALAVPNEAIKQDDQGGSYVEVAVGGKPAPPDKETGTPADADMLVDVKPKKQTVEVGVEGNESTEVKTGLKEGDTIVAQTIEPAPPTTGGGGSPFAGGGGRPGGGFGGGGGRR
jgi:HlyD family secretion protein